MEKHGVLLKKQEKSQSIACRSVAEWCAAFSTDERAPSNENPPQEADQRFADFRAHCHTFQLFADPFSADVMLEQRTTVN